MAAIALPRPGSKDGPCLEAYAHTDCTATRELAARTRAAPSAYLKTLPHGATSLFPSRKQERSGGAVGPIGERALSYILGKDAEQARVPDLSPHDLRHRFGYRMAQSVPSIAWFNSWGTTRWTRRGVTSAAPSRTSSTRAGATARPAGGGCAGQRCGPAPPTKRVRSGGDCGGPVAGRGRPRVGG